MDATLSILTLVVAGLGLLWFFIPIISGIPWVPTQEGRIRKAFKLADVKPGELVCDLGCGDGRVLILATREFGVRAVGYEVSPLHCLLAWVRVWLAGVKGQISIHWKSYYRGSLKDVDVIYFYGHSKYAGKLRRYLQGELHDGARVVSISVDFPGWQPEAIDRNDLIFLYRMPPPPGDVTSYLMSQPDEKRN